MIELLHQCFPATPQAVLAQYEAPLHTVFDRYQINTIPRQASFIAQTGHESAGFTHIVENLNYSADRLRAVWPARFPSAAIAAAYGRNPEKIANKVYANRMGNGDEASGDGWKYRGKGLIQLTGKANHEAFAKAVDMSLDEVCLFLLTPMGATMSAGWFWSTNGLNAFADRGDMLGQTRRINGGTNGLQERVALFGKARLILTRASA